MAELIDETPLGGGLTKRVYDDGRVQVVDADGKFVKHPDNYVPSDVAAELRKQSGVRSKVKLADDIDELLEELELDSTLDKQLASIFLKGGTAAIPAAKELISRSRSQVAKPTPPTPIPGLTTGDVCPYCGREDPLANPAIAAALQGWLENDAVLRAVAGGIERLEAMEDTQQDTAENLVDRIDQNGEHPGVDAFDEIDGETAEALESLQQRLSSERLRIRGAATNDTGTD